MTRLLFIVFAGLIPALALGQSPGEGKSSALDPSNVTAGKVMQGLSGLRIPCEGGLAAEFPCREVDLLSFMTLGELGREDSLAVRANDIWGWRDPQTGREYALVGLNIGTAFIDISDPVNPRLAGRLPRTEGSRASTWRDIKVYDDYAFVVADGAGKHGLQVFDLTRLRSTGGEAVVFTPDALMFEFGSAHNIAINEETGFAYVVGASAVDGRSCGGGLLMIDVRMPLNPTFAGCFADPSTGLRGTGYTHDAQCVTYAGPDSRYLGREICFGLNETGVSIADVTDKNNPVAIAVGRYPDFGYIHQGWLTGDHRFLVVDDEADERTFARPTHTKIFDVTDLEVPIMAASFVNSTRAIDHNLYIRGLYGFQANYTSGLRILDMRDPLNVEEIAYFDTTPADSSVSFRGSWSVYPFFDSGTIVVSSIFEGLFVLEAEALALEIPEETGVSEVWPNPFNATTNLEVALVEPEEVTIVVYDAAGREIEVIHRGGLGGGRIHRFAWDAANLSSGAYLIRISGESFDEVRPITLLK